MRTRRLAMLALLAGGICGNLANVRESAAAPPTPPVPGKSRPNEARVSRRFEAEGIRTVVLRAEAAGQARVRVVPGLSAIAVSARPVGDARGYHPADPGWRETPASEWGLDFSAARYGPTLVVSSRSEVRYIHHYYHLEEIAIEVPPGVAVIRQYRELSGRGEPDLSPPGERGTERPGTGGAATPSSREGSPR